MIIGVGYHIRLTVARRAVTRQRDAVGAAPRAAPGARSAPADVVLIALAVLRTATGRPVGGPYETHTCRVVRRTSMPTKKPTVRDWTLMIYLAGDNNLSSAGAVDLAEMKKVGSTE